MVDYRSCAIQKARHFGSEFRRCIRIVMTTKWESGVCSLQFGAKLLLELNVHESLSYWSWKPVLIQWMYSIGNTKTILLLIATVVVEVVVMHIISTVNGGFCRSFVKCLGVSLCN
ncbi:hypothetical protein DAPPUDRAFT_317996 [Daphnia pulex]|uniref:Uncharacterized protein n=1 Tax=Daphnia pulex TaxID=6669 RepID=E9GHJ6_DAPPU|nr:hypothetical protein DAPPUDRAFT_317996 [Daphnia pulex]|eukprot:EFX80855.1 hypothetical protein DAPPUDRAFT_317996 [Daphnia pulex]